MVVNRLTLLVKANPFARAVACAVALLCAAPVRAEGAQPLDSIRSAAEKALAATLDPSLAGVELEATRLDPRLRLAACAGKLDSFANAPRTGQSRSIVRVSCAAPAWTMNVPVDVRRSHAVLVLKRAVARGETLTAADVAVQTRKLPGLASPFVRSPADLAGRLTRRPLPEGTAIPADALDAPLLIKRGQQVTLLADSAGFEVRAPGRAMADAAAQQRVRVQNLNSLKIVEGVADTQGVVRVAP